MSYVVTRGQVSEHGPFVQPDGTALKQMADVNQPLIATSVDYYWPLPTWEFDVYYTTHDMLAHGIREAARSRVEVAAPDYHEAWKLACWMVICRSGFYVTRTEFVM